MADQASEGLLSPFLRRRRIAAVRPLLRGRVLDIGCGSGALAQYVEPENYLGVERDTDSLAVAKRDYPQHRFIPELTGEDAARFDTVVTLAVIEHVPDPVAFLVELAGRLSPDDAARILCTTPHPSLDGVYDIGARIGLFSHHAHEEHEELFDRKKLADVGHQAGLDLVSYRRFLFGANQLAVYSTSQVE